MSPKSASCPVCRQPASAATRPFCSARCRDRDLLQWLGDGYRVPGPPAWSDDEKSGDYGLDSDKS
ncbi:DNA gyrase inhibitor YacG [Sphingobium sp. AN641]|uniref:DNA gyrase inhibitor YacG n=1 Tax=Sphingobium sp. AN641 TaxID=3133443 RepID=UPI0030BAFEDD